MNRTKRYFITIFSILFFAMIFFMIHRFFIQDNRDVKKVKNPDDIMVLVNRKHELSPDYVPKDLVKPKVRFSPNMDSEKKMMRKEAANALEDLTKAADRNNIKLYCISGYRSYDTQNNIYQAKVKNAGEKEADKYVALPGKSEHQTGLAMDITNLRGIKGILTEDFGSTKEGKWLKENAYKYGFIIRYPKGKEKITGYCYEPWHVRYVGKNAAKDISERNLVLEEYLSKNNK